MATKEDIKKAILAVAGNPESGPIAQLADAMAEAVAKLDAPEIASAPVKETRVIKPEEKR